MITLEEFKKKQSDKCRLIGLDLGSKRIGVSICDEKQLIATPFKTIIRSTAKDLISELKSIIEENNIFLGEELIPFEDLIKKVKTIAGSNTDIRIFLRADTSINYGEVMKVLGALNTSGFLKIALVTKKPS